MVFRRHVEINSYRRRFRFGRSKTSCCAFSNVIKVFLSIRFGIVSFKLLLIEPMCRVMQLKLLLKLYKRLLVMKIWSKSPDTFLANTEISLLWILDQRKSSKTFESIINLEISGFVLFLGRWFNLIFFIPNIIFVHQQHVVYFCRLTWNSSIFFQKSNNTFKM